MLLVVLATILFAFISYRAQQTKQHQTETLAEDKAHFAKVEAEMAKAYDAIIKAAGKPDKTETFKSCSHIAHKYEEGDLHCGVAYSLSYTEATAKQAKERVVSVETSIAVLRTFDQQNSPSLSQKLDSTDSEQAGFNVYKLDNLQCRLSYDLGRKSGTFRTNEIVLESKYIFRCSQAIQQPIYPLAK